MTHEQAAWIIVNDYVYLTKNAKQILAEKIIDALQDSFDLGFKAAGGSIYPIDPPIAAAPDLLAAAVALEKAENARANCEECNGEDVPEACSTCFPLFDYARVARRIAIAKATLTRE